MPPVARCAPARPRARARVDGVQPAQRSWRQPWQATSCPAASSVAQRVRVELGVEPLDEERRAQAAPRRAPRARAAARGVTEKWRPSGSPSGHQPRSRSLASPRLSKVTATAARSLGGDGVLEPPDALDLDHDPVAVAQQHLRVAPVADAARRPGQHDVARAPAGELGDRRDDRRDVEDELAACWPSCIRSPLSSSEMSSACGSPTSSGVTRNGPERGGARPRLARQPLVRLYW